MVTFALCIVTSETIGTVDAETKIGLLILAEIKRGDLTTQIAAIGTGRETSRTCKQCANDLWIYLGLQNFWFLKWWTFSLVEMWMLVFRSGGNDFLIFLTSNDVDLDVLHDEIKLNNEVANFW